MPQFQVYCSEDEKRAYGELSREERESVNKRTRAYWAGLVKKEKEKR